MVRIAALLILLWAGNAWAEVREFFKEGLVPVPANQSREQVIEYTVKSMAREATEEAGIFISSLSEVKDGLLSRDDVVSVAGSIAEITVNRQDPVIIDNGLFVRVEVTVVVDTDTVDSYLRKIIENEEYKKEAADLRKKNLELEKELKNATKEEFDNKLSFEAELLAREQRKRYLEIRDMAEKARADYQEAEMRRKGEELKAREQLMELKEQFAREDAEARSRINAERDAIARAELENSARIEELERNARENKAVWASLSDITAEEAVAEAAGIRSEIAYLRKEFKNRFDVNGKRLKEVYDEEASLIKARRFTEAAPVKTEWMKTGEYSLLKENYEERKADFEAANKEAVKELERKGREAASESAAYAEKAVQDSVMPLIERLEEHGRGRYVSAKEEYAAISFGEKDVDRDTLPITIKYGGKSYDFKYVFDSTADFRAMYETRSGFYAFPTFGAEPDGSGARAFLSGFMTVHLGNGKKAWFKADDGAMFPEVKKYKKEKEKREKAEAAREERRTAGSSLFYGGLTAENTGVERPGRYWLVGASLLLPLYNGADNTIWGDVYYKYNWNIAEKLDVFISAGMIMTSQKTHVLETVYDNYQGWGTADYYKRGSGIGGYLTAGASYFIFKRLFLSGEAGVMLKHYDDFSDYGNSTSYFAGIARGSAGIQLPYGIYDNNLFRAEIIIQSTFGDKGKDDKFPASMGLSVSFGF